MENIILMITASKSSNRHAGFTSRRTSADKSSSPVTSANDIGQTSFLLKVVHRWYNQKHSNIIKVFIKRALNNHAIYVCNLIVRSDLTEIDLFFQNITETNNHRMTSTVIDVNSWHDKKKQNNLCHGAGWGTAMTNSWCIYIYISLTSSEYLQTCTSLSMDGTQRNMWQQATAYGEVECNGHNPFFDDHFAIFISV